MICSTTTPWRALQLVFGRRRRHEDRLAGARLPLVEPQRPVVERGRQAEAELDQRLLARAVAFVHRGDLRHRLVRLVDEQQVVLGEVVDQRRRRLARGAARQVARVVLDALAEPHLLEHLEVVQRALLEPLLLDQLVAGLELDQPLAQLVLDARSSRASAGRPASRSARPGRSTPRRACAAPCRAAGRSRRSPRSRRRTIRCGSPSRARRPGRPRRCRRARGTCRGGSRRRCARTGSRPAGAAPRRAAPRRRARGPASCPGRPRRRRCRRCTTPRRR